MFTFSIANTAAPSTTARSNCAQLHAGTGNYVASFDDGITTYRDDPAHRRCPGTAADVGIRFNAMTFTGDGDRELYAVGNRPGLQLAGSPATISNILYRLRCGHRCGRQQPELLPRQTTPTIAVRDRLRRRSWSMGRAGTQYCRTRDSQHGYRRPHRRAPAGTSPGIAFSGGDVVGRQQLPAACIASTTTPWARAPRRPTSPRRPRISGGSTSRVWRSCRNDFAVDATTGTDVLFAIDNSGELYAFDTQGTLLPMFAGGQTHVPTTINNARGLAFSTLTTNLWKNVTERRNDAGHGSRCGLRQQPLSAIERRESLLLRQPGRLGQRSERQPLRFPRRCPRQSGQQRIQSEGLLGRRSADAVLQLLPGHGTRRPGLQPHGAPPSARCVPCVRLRRRRQLDPAGHEQLVPACDY